MQLKHWSINLFVIAITLFSAPLHSLAQQPSVGDAARRTPPVAKPGTVPAGLHYYTAPKHRFVLHTVRADACVYGGTSAGIIAAVQLRRSGHSVVVIEQGAHLGGLTAGGLSNTDIGNKDAIGGMSRDFYRAVGAHYREPEEWRFEPHVAEHIYDTMVSENHIAVYYREFLQSVSAKNGHIVSITMESGLTVAARVFIDAGYEGDLMAKSHVKYRVGREANSEYEETLNGVEMRNLHQFDRRIDPYVVVGEPASGVLPGIDDTPLPPRGSSDSRVQAYNFRMCLTTIPDNRTTFPKPHHYDPNQYKLLERLLDTGWTSVFDKFDDLKGGKFDKNNDGPVSTDYIGMNYQFPDGSYRTRERIFQQHVTYQMGLMYYLSNDPHVPQRVRDGIKQYGLCKDEFPNTDGWPHALYIREARRMVSDYVMTEHNCTGSAVASDSIGLAAYTMDSHNCRRLIEDGAVRNEGDVQVGGSPPYPISYRSIIPRRSDCDNLMVPVCLAATHIAYGSIRMEPVFMILGQSAALAADIAMKHDCALQAVSYPELREALVAAHQVLAWKPITHAITKQ